MRLYKHRHDAEEIRKAAGEKWKDSDPVITTRNGTPIEPRDFNCTFEAHFRKAGVPNIRVQNIRHSRASFLAALDVHLRAAMRIMRHSQISMTMDVYTQIPSPESARRSIA